VHENQGRGNRTTGVPDGGELRKTNPHSPLEILRDLYTAKRRRGQHNFEPQQGSLPVLSGHVLTNLAFLDDFFIRSQSFRTIKVNAAGKLRAARCGCA
jgi:hypothetical protein